MTTPNTTTTTTEDLRFSYEETEERVQAYKSGNVGAAERLVEAFSGYIIRWLQVLNGQASYSSKYHRTFVSLYIPHRGKRIRILKGDPRGATEFLYWSQIVRDRYSTLSRDEKWNELVICLLELGKRYQPWENYVNFHTYVMRSFAYYLHRRLEIYFGDMSSFANITVPLSDSNDDEGYESQVPATIDDPDLSTAWVSGATAGDGFSTLTPMDRQIMLYYYQDGLSDRQISERLGLGRCSINRRRIRAKEKLENALKGV